MKRICVTRLPNYTITLLVLFAAIAASVLSISTANAASDADAAYSTCAGYWRQLDWKHKGDHKALAAGVNGDRYLCFATWNARSGKSAENASLDACKKQFSKCFIFAVDNSLEAWAQELIDNRTGKKRSSAEYAYLRCADPDYWPDYVAAGGPKAMAISEAGSASGCDTAQGSDYESAMKNALDRCRSNGKSKCSVFAIGNAITADWMKVGDRLRGKERPYDAYLFLACSSPLVAVKYFGDKEHKALAIGIRKSDGQTSCFSNYANTTPRDALDAALASCRREKGVDCYTFAVDENLATWAKRASDTMRGHVKSSDDYMVYACLFQGYLDGYGRAPVHKAAVAQYAQKNGYSCFWRVNASDLDSAKKAAMRDCQTKTPKGVHPRCAVVALENTIQQPYANLLTGKHAPAKAAVGATISVSAALTFCATPQQLLVPPTGKCTQNETKLKAKDAVVLANGWKTPFCGREGGGQHLFYQSDSACRKNDKLVKNLVLK